MNNILEFKKQELKLLESANYSNNPQKYLKWFLSNAKFFTDIDQKLSKKISELTDSRVKSCYHNCWKAVTEPQYYYKLRYFEGFVYSKDCPLPLEHSWLVARNGKVVDPTLIIDSKTSDKQLKQDGYNVKELGRTREKRTGDEYFGVEFPVSYLNKLVIKHERTGGFLVDLFLSDTKVDK